MSYTKNTIFYKDFTAANGYEYRLEFVPGDTVDLSSPAEVEFPNNVIFNEITLKGGFADPLPKGLPGANTMKLKLNLGNMTGDWADVKQWILNGQSGAVSGSTFTPAKRSNIRAYGGTVYLDDVYIPNVWKLKILDYELLGSTIDYYIYVGYQDNIPEVEREINRKWNDEIISITTMGIEKLVFSSVKFKYWADFNMTTIDPADINITRWTDSSEGDIYYYGAFTLNYEIEHSSLYNMMTAIETFAETYLRAYLRSNSPSTNITSTPFSSWRFYENDYSTQTNSHGSVLTTTDLLFVGRLILDSTNIAGMLVDSDSENNLFEYDNIWDYLVFETDAFKSKAYFFYDSGGSIALNLVFRRMFSTTATTLEDDDIVGDKIKIKSGVSDITISEAISHIRDIPDDDIDEIQYKMAGTAFQNTDEHELNWHNHLVMFKEGYNQPSVNFLLPERTFVRMLLHKGSDSLYYKVNDYCEYDTGDGETFTSDTGYDTSIPDFPSKKKIEADSTFGIAFKQYIDTRLSKSGLGYVTAKAMANIFSSRYQALIDDVEITHHSALLQHVGDRYDLNLSELSAPFGQEAYLVEVEIDVINSLSKCKFYLKGSYDT